MKLIKNVIVNTRFYRFLFDTNIFRAFFIIANDWTTDRFIKLLYRIVYTRQSVKSLCYVPNIFRQVHGKNVGKRVAGTGSGKIGSRSGIFKHRNLPRNKFFYNGFGRMLFVFSELFRLAVGKKSKRIQLETFDEITYPPQFERGNPDIVWPPSPFQDSPPGVIQVQQDLLERLGKSYQLSCDLDKKLPQSEWWEKQSAAFRQAFMDEKDDIKIDALVNFRGRSAVSAGIIRDQVTTIYPGDHFVSYVRSIFLVSQYHKTSQFADPEVLCSLSESFIGNNRCPVYRGLRLTSRVLSHAFYMSSIKNHIDFKLDDDITILDLGGGYGAFLRILGGYYSNSKLILIELPEVSLLASFFLTYAMPDRRVGMLSDINIDDFKTNGLDWQDYDVFVLPTWAIEYLQDDSVDMVVNTASIGELSEEYGRYYLEHIERITSGFFYSSNRQYSDVEQYDDFGFYNWKFSDKWLTLLNRNAPTGQREWIGKVTRK
jgi:putative sugar O-methyltransferase